MTEQTISHSKEEALEKIMKFHKVKVWEIKGKPM